MRKIYNIPQNVVKGSKIFNGTIEIRNAIEAGVLAIFGLFLCSFIPVPSDKRLSLIILVCVPLGFLGLSGIQGEPFSSYLFNCIHWIKNRKPYLYNPNGKAYDTTYADIYLGQTQLRDMLSDILDKAKSKMTVEKEYIEGETFKFAVDPSWDFIERATQHNIPAKEAQQQASPAPPAPEHSLDLTDLMNAQFDSEEES